MGVFSLSKGILGCIYLSEGVPGDVITSDPDYENLDNLPTDTY